MKRSSVLLIISIILLIFVYIIYYFIVKSGKCKADCHTKKCGSKDGCGNIYKTCPPGETYDGKQCKPMTSENFKNKIKGICYFDIDDTLTSAMENTDEIIQECLDNNFAVGIITASGRTIDDICSGDKAGGYQNANWMSNKLCKQFREENGKMFNSLRVVAGNTEFPESYPNGSSYGYIKGFNMQYGKDNYYPDVKDKCTILFDDNPYVLNDVKKFNPNFEVQCANRMCGGDLLSKDMVKQKIQRMIKNGCK